MKEQQNADLPNSDSLGETADNQKGKLSDVMQGFSKTNEINLNKEEQKMINNKNQERSEDHELNIQRILARNVCKITEDGRILWNEAIVVKLLEKTGICRVDYGGDYKPWVYNNGETVDLIRPDRLILHLIGFLMYVGQHDIADILSANYTYLSDNVIHAIKEESYEDVFGFEDDEFDCTDDDCSLSEAPPPLRKAPPEVLGIE